LDWLLQDEEKNRSDYETYEQHINALYLTIAREFLKRHPEAYKGVRNLNKRLQNIIDIGVQPEPSGFFSHLCKVIEPSYATEMCEVIIEMRDCPLALYLAYLLHRARIGDVNRAIAISQRALDTEIPVLCAAVAQVYHSCIENLHPHDFELVKNLLADTHFGVKLLAINSLKILGSLEPQSTIDLALNVDISDSTELASRLCQLFYTDYGIPPETLTNEELDTLLKKIEPTVNIDKYHISEFLAYVSKRLPHSLVQLFLNRIKRDEEDKKGKYQPLPFQGFQHRLVGIAESNEYKDILICIRNQSLQRTEHTKFWFSKLFRDVSLVPDYRSSTNQSSSVQETTSTRYSYEDGILIFSPTSIEVLSEWINSEDRNKIEAVSCLLSDAPQAFVFQNVEFVSNLLEQAYELGDDCYTTVTIDLLNSVNSGVRSGTPGQPLPEDVAIKEQSAAVAEQLIAESPSHQFYDCLVKNAKAYIEYWEKRWEEFGEL
jgi:hypothetical protein